jgi:hypothetical protein
MGELRYPNESMAYREARDALLKDEQELVDKVKSVAARRRALPPGGELKEDYVFQWASEGKVGTKVKFSELFGDKSTLLLYSFMFGPNWDNPCPSCTSLMDGFDRTWYQVSPDAAFAAIAKAPAARINDWARQRGVVPDSAPVGSRLVPSVRLQMPGGLGRHAVAGDACLPEAGRTIPPFLGHRSDDEPRRYRVAVLEPDGLHAGGAAGHSDPTAAVQVQVPGGALLEEGVAAGVQSGISGRGAPRRAVGGPRREATTAAPAQGWADPPDAPAARPDSPGRRVSQ